MYELTAGTLFENLGLDRPGQPRVGEFLRCPPLGQPRVDLELQGQRKG